MPSRSDGSALAGYLGVVRRRKWLIITTTLLVALGVGILSVTTTPVYESTSKVLLSERNLADALTGMVTTSRPIPSETLVQTQAEVARVPEIAERVATSLDEPELTTSEVSEAIAVSTEVDSEILEFSAQSTDAKLAEAIAGEYAEQFTIYRRELDTASLASASASVRARLRRLENADDADSSLYSSLAQQEEELRTLRTLQTANASVIQTPTAAEQVAPRPLRNVVLGLFVGLILGLSFAFLREGLDTRLRTTDEISERLALPLLGRLPAPPKKLAEANQLVTMENPRGVHAEAFRILRTNLQFAALDRDLRSILVTSALMGEGKSTTAANLALAFARVGQKVVLVDLDLRRPRLHMFFHLSQGTGLSDALLGRVEVEDALVDVPVVPSSFDQSGSHLGAPAGSLEVLGTGSLPPDPGELVTSPTLGKILRHLKERSDLVILDSPPILHVGDAIALSRMVDGVLVVCNFDSIRRGTADELRRQLDATRAHQLGYALTAASLANGYAYNYGYELAPSESASGRAIS